ESSKLLRANGAVTMTTFVAVLAGGALAGPLLDALAGQLWLSGAACIALALLGIYSATRIQKLHATMPSLQVLRGDGWNPLTWGRTLFSGLFSTIGVLSRKDGLLT